MKNSLYILSVSGVIKNNTTSAVLVETSEMVEINICFVDGGKIDKAICMLHVQHASLIELLKAPLFTLLLSLLKLPR